MFCGKTNLNKLEKLQESVYGLFSVIQPPHVKISWHEEISCLYPCIEYDVCITMTS